MLPLKCRVHSKTSATHKDQSKKQHDVFFYFAKYFLNYYIQLVVSLIVSLLYDDQGYVIASPAVDIYQERNMKVLYAYHMTLIPKKLYEVILH